MVDIATLGFSIDSSQAGSAATNLDRLSQAATNAERSSSRLEQANQSMGRALAMLVQGQNQQIQLMERMVQAQVKMAERTTSTTRTVADMARGMDVAAKSMGSLSAAMDTFVTAADKAWKAAERLDDAFDSMWSAMGVASGGGNSRLSSISKDMEDLGRVTGTTATEILSTNRAIDQLKLGVDQSVASFQRVNQIMSDSSEKTKAYKERIEAYIGSIKGLSGGEVTARLVTAFNQTADSAQKTADAMMLLGVRGSEGLKKLSEAGKQVYSDEMKRLDQLEAELIRRQRRNEAALKEMQEKEAERRKGLGMVGRAIEDIPIVGWVAGMLGADTAATAATSFIDKILINPMKEFFRISDEGRVKMALIGQETSRIWKESRGFFGSIAGAFEALYNQFSGMIKLAAGTYEVTVGAGDNLGQFSSLSEALEKGKLQKRINPTESEIKIGQQFMGQFDETRSATLKFNETQRVANELFEKGVIGANDLAKALFEAGQQYTRTTGNANLFIEGLRKTASNENSELKKAADQIAADAEAVRKKIADLRAAAADLGDVSGLLQSEIDRLAKASNAQVAPLVNRLVDRAAILDDMAWIRQMEAEAARQVSEWQIAIQSGAPSEAVIKQTEALKLQAAEIDILAESLAQYGVAGDEAAKRTVAIFQQIRKEVGDFAAGQFLKDDKIPAMLKEWADALDKVAERTKALQVQRAVMSEEREAEKIQITLNAYKLGPAAIAENERAMKLLTIANNLGYESFQKLSELFPTYANRLRAATDAAASAKVVMEATSAAAAAARNAAAAADVANLGPMDPARMERERIRLEVDRAARERMGKLPAYDIGGRLAVQDEARKEVESRLQQQEAEARTRANASIYQRQLENSILRAQRQVATADPAVQQATAARIDFVRGQMMERVRTEQDLARAHEVLAGKTKLLTEEEQKAYRVYLDTARISRSTEIAKYADGLEKATEAARLLAEAEGMGPAYARAAQAQVRISQAPGDVKEITRANEIKRELVEISRLVGQFEGQAKAAENISDAYFQAIANGAATVQELSLEQEKYNAVLNIGHSITGDSAELEKARAEAITAAVAAIDRKTIAEGRSLTVQQQLKAAFDLENLKAYNAALIAGGAAMGEHLQNTQRNAVALANYKTTYDKLEPKEQERVKTLVATNAALEAQQRVTEALNALQRDRDNLEYLRAEINLVGASRREREITLQTIRLQQEEQHDLNRYIGQEGEEVEKSRQKIRDAYAERRQLVADTVDAQMRKQDLQQEAQVWQDIWKNAFSGIQSAFSNFFSEVLNGGINTWEQLAESLKRVMFQVIAQITAAMVFRPIVGNLLNGMGASYDFMSSVGLGSFSSSAPAGVATGSSGFGLPGFGGGDMMGRMLGPGFSNWYNTPWFQVGGTTPQAVTASGAAIGEIGGATGTAGFGQAGFSFGPSNILPVAGAGLSIYNAIQNPNVGTIGGAALTTGGAIAGMIPSLSFLGPYGLIAGGILSLLGNTLFKKKPSNLGAEYSFNLDEEFTTQFEGTKHPDQMAFVKSFSDPLQDLIMDMERRYGVTRRADATIGTTYGRKEGSNFFYDAGPRDGGIEGRQVFQFDPESEESTTAALNQLTVAFLKDADWTGIGQRIGERAAADVSIALENSAADTVEALLSDVDFAAQFSTLVDIGTGALTPLEAAFSRVEQQGAAAGQQLAMQIEDFYQRAKDLGLGTEEMANGLTGAQNATRGFIDSLFEIPGSLDPIASTTAMVKAQFDALTPTLLSFGYTLEQVGTIVDQQIALATQAIRQAQINAQVNMESMLGAALDPNYRMPADTLLYNAVGYKFNIGPGGGPFSPLADAINRAAAGDAGALQEVYNRLQANIGKSAAGIGGINYQVMTQQEAASIFSTVSQWFTSRDPARQQQTGSSGISSGGGSGGGGGGGGSSGGSDTSEQQRLLREQITALNNNSRELSNWANQFGRMAVALLDYRKSLLLGPLTPLTPYEQYQEANRQFEDALARSRSSDKETAIKGMDDLRTSSQNLLEKSRAYYASNERYQQDFDRVQRELLSVGNLAKSIEEQQLDQLKLIEDQLKDANEKLTALQNQTPSGGQSGVITTPGGGTTPSTNYPANQFPYASQGILFGVSGMGRALTENAETFMKRRFDPALYGGPYDETSAYNWMQQQHPSGLGITRNQYYAAATKAGFTGKFGGAGNAHLNFLNNDKTGNEWRDFILELRKMTTVQPGHFKAQMATDLPEFIYTFDRGGVVGRFGNVVPFPTRQGLVANTPVMMRLMGGTAVAGERRDEAIMPLTRTASGDMGVRAIGGEDVAMEVRRLIQQGGSAWPQALDLLRTIAQRLDDLEGTVRRKEAA